MNRAMFSNARDAWYTPEVVLGLVRQIDDIGLDPCAGPGAVVDAKTEWFGEPDVDGLAKRWQGLGLAFVNPPYSHIAQWAEKIAQEAETGIEIVALLPSRTDTRWMHDWIFSTADVICFWKGRLRFIGAANSAPFPSLLAYWGPRVERFCEVFDDAGHISEIAPANDNVATPHGAVLSIAELCLRHARSLAPATGMVRQTFMAEQLADAAATCVAEEIRPPATLGGDLDD